MSTETLGEKLRQMRVQNEFPLRKVAALIDIDVAILSKMERNERKLTKEVVLKLADLYKYDIEELLVLFLSEKIMCDIQNEEFGEKALIVAEQKVKFLKANKDK